MRCPIALLPLLLLAASAAGQSVLHGEDCPGLLPAPTISYSGSNLPGKYGAVHLDGERLIVVGGAPDSPGTPLARDDVQVFDPISGLWDADTLPDSPFSALPWGRGGAGAAVFWQGELYVFGGEEPSGASGGGSGPGPTPAGVHERVDVLDPIFGSWRLEAPLPTARHGHHPVLFPSRIFVAGGHEAAGVAPSRRLEILTRQ